jgi:hypothetical protein
LTFALSEPGVKSALDSCSEFIGSKGDVVNK